MSIISETVSGKFYAKRFYLCQKIFLLYQAYNGILRKFDLKKGFLIKNVKLNLIINNKKIFIHFGGIFLLKILINAILLYLYKVGK